MDDLKRVEDALNAARKVRAEALDPAAVSAARARLDLLSQAARSRAGIVAALKALQRGIGGADREAGTRAAHALEVALAGVAKEHVDLV